MLFRCHCCGKKFPSMLITKVGNEKRLLCAKCLHSSAWTPLAKGEPVDMGIRGVDTKEVWLNNYYTVFVYRKNPLGEGDPRIVHLSIKRNNREQLRSWRDLQRIKNELCGTTCTAVEIFPPEKNLVDTSNQYHLWCMEPGYELPFGFAEGRVCDNDPEFKQAQIDAAVKAGIDPADIPKLTEKAVQAEYEPHHRSDDCPEVGPLWEGFEG